MRVGGTVGAVVEPLCTNELIEAVLACKEENLPFAIVGRGSNTIFGDHPEEFVVIRSIGVDALRISAGGRIRAGCGTSLSALCLCAAREGLAGLSFASGIPGTVGGGVLMNAGAYEGSLADVIETVTVFDIESGKIRTLFNNELSFSYRYCDLQQKRAVILSAVLHLPHKAEPGEIFAEMRAVAERRRCSQPLDLPNAGSVFRRSDPNVPLSKMLDHLGLKGMTVGGARVSEKHAGFIVNAGGATAQDVRTLIQSIQAIVKKECGFLPIPEVRFIPEEV